MSSSSENHESKHEKVYDSFFQKLFTDAQATDIYFQLQFNGSKSSFSGHKLILSMWSPYFADQFEIEKNNLIQLKDINPKYFQAMLRFMYSFPINPMETAEEVCGMYFVAKKFQVNRLIKECHNSLNSIEILASNIFDMLQAANCLQNEGTKYRCLNFFQENTREVFAANYDLSKISPSMMSFLLTSKKLSLDSLCDLFIQIFAWGKTRCNHDNRFSTSREAIEEFFPQLPFASLKVEEFADLCRCYQSYFYNNEVIQFFMNYAFPEGEMPGWYNRECQMKIKSSN